MRPAAGTWIFGCDICQDVCPWNRFATGPVDPALSARPEIVAPEMITLLALDEEGFRAHFPRSAVRRAKRGGFVRNVAVALGNTGDPRAVPALVKAMREDPDPLVRGHAAWALGRLGGCAARDALDRALSVETNEEVREGISSALRG